MPKTTRTGKTTPLVRLLAEAAVDDALAQAMKGKRKRPIRPDRKKIKAEIDAQAPPRVTRKPPRGQRYGHDPEEK